MTVAFKTLGCRLNQAEEVVFASQFLAAGWRLATTDETPDVIVLHSCAVTRAAERETFRQIRSWRKDPRFAHSLIVVTGCAVACNAPELFRDAGADLVVPKRDLGQLASLVLSAVGGTQNNTLCGSAPSAALRDKVLKPSSHKRALLKVQDGCGFNCAYCIVPLTRGKPVSRPWKESLADAQRLLDQSYKEIVLTGCNLACYRDGIHGLAELADAICGLAEPYGARIRLGSVEPGICDDELLSVLLSRRNLCRFLHYPIQSGDTGVLRAMGRRYTAEYITELLQRVRDKMPLIGLGADFITGLPGEDEDAFSHTCALVEAIPFVHIHVFPYSPRQGTLAPTLPNRPSRTIAKERASRLRAIGDVSAAAYRQLLLGHETQVLVEKRLPDSTVTGWNEGYVPCRFSSDAPVATLAAFTPTRIVDGALK